METLTGTLVTSHRATTAVSYLWLIYFVVSTSNEIFLQGYDSCYFRFDLLSLDEGPRAYDRCRLPGILDAVHAPFKGCRESLQERHRPREDSRENNILSRILNICYTSFVKSVIFAHAKNPYCGTLNPNICHLYIIITKLLQLLLWILQSIEFPLLYKWPWS